MVFRMLLMDQWSWLLEFEYHGSAQVQMGLRHDIAGFICGGSELSIDCVCWFKLEFFVIKFNILILFILAYSLTHSLFLQKEQPKSSSSGVFHSLKTWLVEKKFWSKHLVENCADYQD